MQKVWGRSGKEPEHSRCCSRRRSSPGRTRSSHPSTDVSVLEMDQISVAKKLLEVADNSGGLDWRVVLARGTVLAKEGRYREAINLL